MPKVVESSQLGEPSGSWARENEMPGLREENLQVPRLGIPRVQTCQGGAVFHSDFAHLSDEVVIKRKSGVHVSIIREPLFRARRALNEVRGAL